MLHPAHAGHGGSVEVVALIPLVLVAVLGSGYVVLSARARMRQAWPPRRTGAFLAGLALLAAALSPPFDGFADRDFSGHAAQHLVIAMVAPLLLVLGAPVTLLLRTLPHPAARRLGATLNTRPLQLLTTPAAALVLSSGGLVVLYFTPLYALSTESPAVHALVHVHLVMSGFLFAWVVAGIDPAAHRAGVRTRLVTLGLAIAVHSVVSQLLYAGLLVQVREPVPQMQGAGSLMYFGGDIAELCLALTMLLAAKRGRVDHARRSRTAQRDPSASRVEAVRPRASR